MARGFNVFQFLLQPVFIPLTHVTRQPCRHIGSLERIGIFVILEYWINGKN
jgi:hypothetical protein